MISEKENIRISKFLSLVLRHQPETINIELDSNGWTDVALLLQELNSHGVAISLDILKHVVSTNPKNRFSFNETCDRIRANQGHSVDVQLGYKSQQPPSILYHGTAERFVPKIIEEGLIKGNRHHVHLSADRDTAIKVGQRHGKPFVFEVMAEVMFNDNLEFYLSDNSVWLTDHVPPKYLRRTWR